MNDFLPVSNLAGELHVEEAVRERYSSASHAVEACLCCAVEYDRRFLEVLPAEILQRDYGCGDPTRDVRPGETVLDLGSGAGKVCYIASQIVGATGQVIGVDMNDDMLSLARRHQAEIGRHIGWQNTRFGKARIQDLALDLERLDLHLREHPIRNVADWLETQRLVQDFRQNEPLIPNASVDVALSNCVLNLVHPDDRAQLFAELHRVLKASGRAVISDIVSNQPVPAKLQNDPELWSGCISGAFEEGQFFESFRRAGFADLETVARQSEPWQIVEGIEFRSITVRAWKSTALPVTGGCCGSTGNC